MKALKNKQDKDERRTEWEAPRLKVNPSECPVTRERSDRRSEKRSDRRSRRRDSCKKEDLAYDLFDCNSNVPRAGGQGRARIPIVPQPEFPDENDKASRRSHPSGSGKKEKGDLTLDLFDCRTNARNAVDKGKGKIPVLPPPEFASPPPVKVSPPPNYPGSKKSGSSSRASKSKGFVQSDSSSEKMAPDMLIESIDVWPPPGTEIIAETNDISAEPAKSGNAKSSEKLRQSEKISRTKKEAKKGKQGKSKGQKKNKD